MKLNLWESICGSPDLRAEYDALVVRAEKAEETFSAWEQDRDNWRAAFYACEVDAKKAEARILELEDDLNMTMAEKIDCEARAEELRAALEMIVAQDPHSPCDMPTRLDAVCAWGRQALAEDGKSPDQTDQSGEP